MMTDKERIEQIIRSKQMTNVEFCSQTCMAPATLSHILSERTKPTIAILRNVVEAFPDISPMWILMGQGDMYLSSEGQSSTLQGVDSSHTAQAPSDDVDDVFGAFRTGLSGASVSAPGAGSSAQQVQQTTHAGASAQLRPSQQSAAAPRVNVEEVVDLTLRRLQKPQRKVTEVRIFFDDGTYETFSTR